MFLSCSALRAYTCCTTLRNPRQEREHARHYVNTFVLKKILFSSNSLFCFVFIGFCLPSPHKCFERARGDEMCLRFGIGSNYFLYFFSLFVYRKFDNHCGIATTSETKRTCNDCFRFVVVHIGFALLLVQSTADGHSIH